MVLLSVEETHTLCTYTYHNLTGLVSSHSLIHVDVQYMAVVVNKRAASSIPS